MKCMEKEKAKREKQEEELVAVAQKENHLKLHRKHRQQRQKQSLLKRKAQNKESENGIKSALRALFLFCPHGQHRNGEMAFKISPFSHFKVQRNSFSLQQFYHHVNIRSKASHSSPGRRYYSVWA